MKDGTFQNTMKQFAAAILQPVAILTVIGTILTAGVVLSFGFMPEPLRMIGGFITTVLLEGVMQQLPLIFCVAVTCALTKKKKTEAATMAVISFLIFIYANHYWLACNGLLAEPLADHGLIGSGQSILLGLQVVDMGFFLGIILACINAFFLNRFSRIEFTGQMAEYGGTILACLLDALCILMFAVAMCYIWPIINRGIQALTGFLSAHGNLGLFIYDFLQRFLISTGLHHLIYMPFYFSQLGGTLVLNGTAYSGAQVIWLAEIANVDKLSSLHDSVRYMTCGFAQVCGFLGASLAFLRTAEKDQRKAVLALLLPLATPVLLKGITEPFEFTFMFTAPLLWFAHSVLDGLSQVFLYVMGSRLPMSGGLIDAIIDALLVPSGMSRWYIMAACAVPVTIVWYLVFVFLIRKWNLLTPGRPGYLMPEPKTDSRDTSDLQRQENDAEQIIAGLGGADNIQELSNCATRLRIVVKDPSKIKEDLIGNVANSGIVRKENNIQIIIGTSVGNLKNRISEKLGIDQ